MSSCSSSRKYSHKTSKRSKIERTRSTAKVSKKKSTNGKSNSKRTRIVTSAKKYIGKSYTYGGKKPSTGFDCSGFTAHVFNNNGVNLSGPSHYQAKQGKRISMSDLQEGDLVFFGTNNKVSHVAIVADVNHNKLKVIHSTSSRGVVIDDISSSKYWKKRYLFGRDVMN
jgi:cell wall-associated NlpC family hydrolase